MLGTILGIGLGVVILVGAWSAAGFADGFVSTGAVTLGVLGALSVATFVALLANAGHQEPE